MENPSAYTRDKDKKLHNSGWEWLLTPVSPMTRCDTNTRLIWGTQAQTFEPRAKIAQQRMGMSIIYITIIYKQT